MPARPRNNSPTLGVAAAMIGDASAAIVPGASAFNHTFEVAIDTVAPDPAQARRHFDRKALATLAATLAAEGQLQPILLRRDPDRRGHWIIVAGERRWRAARLLQWTRLLAIAHDGDPETASLIENLQRVDLSPVEEARGIGRLISQKGWTQEQAARALGKPRSDISGTLRILTLPEHVLNGVLTSEHPPAKNVLVELSRITDRTALGWMMELAQAGNLTVRAIREYRDYAATYSPLPRPLAEGTREWRTVRQATRMLTSLAASRAVPSDTQAASLRELRDAVDRLLAPAPTPPGWGIE